MSVLGQMFEKYDTTTVEGRVNGLREVMQEVAGSECRLIIPVYRVKLL